MSQLAEVRAGGSYLSSNDQRLHFGLGSDATIARILVQWPSGTKDEFQNVAADSIYTITEGGSIKEVAKLPPLAPKTSETVRQR